MGTLSCELSSILPLKVKGQGQISPKCWHFEGLSQHIFISGFSSFCLVDFFSFFLRRHGPAQRQWHTDRTKRIPASLKCRQKYRIPAPGCQNCAQSVQVQRICDYNSRSDRSWRAIRSPHTSRQHALGLSLGRFQATSFNGATTCLRTVRRRSSATLQRSTRVQS